MADPKKDNSEQNQDPKKQDNKQEVKTDIQFDSRDAQAITSLNLNTVFTSMHKKAYEMAIASVKNIEIINSAINNKGQFLGAGQHVIIAQPIESENLIKTDCLTAIKTYVHWFSGPDVENSITLDSLQPLTRPKTDEEQEASTETKKDEEQEASDETKKDEEKEETSGENEETNNDNENKEAATDEQQANESLQTYIYQIDNNMLDILFESTQEQDEVDAKNDGLKITGYQAQYQLDIPGQKTHSFAQTMKNVGKYFAKGLLNQLGGIGFQSWDWRSGAKGEVHTLGDMAKKFVKKISPDKLVNAVKKEFSKKFPGNIVELAVLDSKSIVNHLQKRLLSGDKGKILKIPYALCIKVHKNDKSYELINKKSIVKFVIDGLAKSKDNIINANIKTWQKITPNDVILVNNYTDKHYSEESKKVKKLDDISNESLENVFDIYHLIFEDLDIDKYEIIKQLLIEKRKNKIGKAARKAQKDRSDHTKMINQQRQILQHLQNKNKKNSEDSEDNKENNKKKETTDTSTNANTYTDDQKDTKTNKDNNDVSKDNKQQNSDNSKTDKTSISPEDYDNIINSIKDIYSSEKLADKENKDKLAELINGAEDRLSKEILSLLERIKDPNEVTKADIQSILTNINDNKIKELVSNPKEYISNQIKSAKNNITKDNKKIMAIKYLYIKNDIGNLISKDCFSFEKNYSVYFSKTNEDKLKNIKVDINDDGTISDDDYNKLKNIIPLSDEDTDQFYNKKPLFFTEVLKQLNNNATIGKAKEKYDTIIAKEKDKAEADKKANKDKQNAEDREANKKALDKNITEMDMYIIPIKGINFDKKE